MKNINWKTFTAGLACGLVFGFGIFYLSAQPHLGAGTPQRYRFEKAGPEGWYMMRLDTQSGKAWRTQTEPGGSGWKGAWHWEEVADPGK